jgi:hypothetical protein
LGKRSLKSKGKMKNGKLMERFEDKKEIIETDL